MKRILTPSDAMHDPIYALGLVISLQIESDTVVEVVERHPRFLRYARGDLLNKKQRKEIR